MYRQYASRQREQSFGQRYKEVSSRTPHLARESSRPSFFSQTAYNVLVNIEGFIGSLLVTSRHLRDFLASDIIVSYEFWFAVLSSWIPGLRRKLVYRDGAGEWMRICAMTAPFLVRLKYGVIGAKAYNRIRVIAQSELNKSLMVRSGVDRGRVSVFRHGRVDESIFHPKGTKTRKEKMEFLFVGRIAPEKGVHILLNAADQIVNKIGVTNVKFKIVGPAAGWGFKGSTAYSNSILEGIRHHNLAKYIEVLPFTGPAELASIYSSADVLVLPSLVDAYPSVVAESMMCGTPVIGTRSGGMTEMIQDGKTGLLIEPNDVSALVNALSEFITNSQLASRMGREAFQFAQKRFSLIGASNELFQVLLTESHELN